MLWVNAVCSNWKVEIVQPNLKPWHFIIRLLKQLVKLTFIHGWLKLVPDTMFQSARWCVETFQLKQLIVFHFLFQVCDPLSRTASVTTVSRSNHLLVLYKVTCNQKGFYRNHQLRKLPTSTFQQVIWLSLRCCCATWAVFDCCLLVAALRLRTDLVSLKFRLQICEICLTFGL